MLNVLIVGRDGQVARALLRSAPVDLAKTISLGRPHLDIRDPISIEQAMRDTTPDLVINAAAYTAVDQAESEEDEATLINGWAVGELAKKASARGIPFIHLSTDYVFDGGKRSPYVETDTVSPLGAYGRSKLAGERAAKAENAHSVLLRTAWVYSPWGRNFVKTMLRLAETRDELAVVHDQVGNPTSAEDIAAGIWAIARKYHDAATSLVPGTYHMTSSGEASWAEFAEEIFAVSREFGGPTARVKRTTSANYPTPTKRPENSRLDCGKLHDVYCIRLPDWRQSTRKVVEELIRTEGWSA